MTELDPLPFRNRHDGTRWAHDGGAPDLLPLDPRPEFEQDRTRYDHLLSLDPAPYLDTMSPSGRRFERRPARRPMWTEIRFRPRPGYCQTERRYLDTHLAADAEKAWEEHSIGFAWDSEDHRYGEFRAYVAGYLAHAHRAERERLP